MLCNLIPFRNCLSFLFLSYCTDLNLAHLLYLICRLEMHVPVDSEVYFSNYLCSFPSVEKFPQEKPPLLPHHSSSTPRPRVPPWHSAPLPPGHSSSTASPSERPSAQKPAAGQASECHSPLRGTRTYSRIYKNINSKSAVYICCFFLLLFCHVC